MAEWLWHRTSTMFAKYGHTLFSTWSIKTEIGICVVGRAFDTGLIKRMKGKKKIIKLTFNCVAHFRDRQTESYRQLQKPLERWQALDSAVLFEMAVFESREWPPLRTWWLSG
ncbi:hypothetical protein TNCT_224621 [Trichonephila clavata]|uniref:Uncharacterized protein n=1 Tax=Trichonephila clavata TaxID=2740835 RepID=A0A8X6LM78_TRICU|nr:hypothetical protein TNCT_224621 [Trichonephila clavata]